MGAQLNIYQIASGEVTMLYKGYTAKGKRELSRPLIPFALAERRLLTMGYSLVDVIPMPVIYESGEYFEKGDIVLKDGVNYEVQSPVKPDDDFESLLLKGVVSDKVPRILRDKVDAISRLNSNDSKTTNLRFATELVSHKEQTKDITQDAMAFKEVLSDAIIANKTGSYYAEISGEILSDVVGSVALVRVKKDNMSIAESYIKNDVVDQSKRFSIKTRVFDLQSEFLFSTNIEFALENIEGAPTITAKNFDIKLFGQINESELI
jgi:hypothetical protein